MKHRYALLSLLIAAHSHAADQRNEPFSLQLEERITHDSNLFRLPETPAAEAALGQYRAHRAELINRASAIAAARAGLDQQQFSLDARLDDNRFQHNGMLDHTAGDADGRWDWSLGDELGGQLGHRYRRALTGFDNSRVLLKDLIDTQEDYLAAHYALGPRWSLLGDLNQRDTSHSEASRRSGDNTLTGWRGGLRYTTPAGNSFGLDQRGSRTAFDSGLPDQDFQDDWLTLNSSYAFSAKTRLEAQAGRQSRDYRNTGDGDFSGGTGRATLYWQASSKTRVELAAFRELQSYVEEDSDYFVSLGQRLGAHWQASDKFRLDLGCQRARHDHQRQGPALTTAPLRQDDLDSLDIGASYSPRQYLDLGLQLKREQRDSNQPENDFDADTISATVNVQL